MKKPTPGFDWHRFEQSLRRVVDRVVDKAIDQSEKGKCLNCGSDRLQWRGKDLRVQTTAKRRVRCMNCGLWGTRLAA